MAWLKLVGESIRQVFGGDVGAFLEESGSGTVFGGIRRLLAEQIERSSALEREVLRVLAAERQPVTLAELARRPGPARRAGDAPGGGRGAAPALAGGARRDHRPYCIHVAISSARVCDRPPGGGSGRRDRAWTAGAVGGSATHQGAGQRLRTEHPGASDRRAHPSAPGDGKWPWRNGAAAASAA